MRKLLGVNVRADALESSLVAARFRKVISARTEDVELPSEKAEQGAVVASSFERWKKELSPEGVVLGLPLRHFSHQFLEMPSMSRQDLRHALTFELEKYLPLPVEEYIFDFVQVSGEKGKVKVLVLSVRKEAIRDLAKAVTDNGLELRAVRCSMLDALAGVIEAAGEKQAKGLFVNVTDHSYEVAGLEGGVPAYLKWFTKETDLQAELERLSAIYPGPVYFLGNAGPVTERFNSRKFQIPVATCLALSQSRKIHFDMNFVPPELVKQKKDYYPYMLAGLAGASLLVFLLTGVFQYINGMNALRTIESRRASIRGRAAEVIEARRKLDLLQGDWKALNDFASGSSTATRALRDLSSVLPKDAWIVNFSADDKGKVEIEGFTGNAASLVITLEKSRVFRNVSFSAPVVAKDGEERFSLKMEVEESS